MSKTAFLFAADSETNKVSIQCCVGPELLGKGLKANEWASEIALHLDGKCGGKQDMAQGAGVGVEKVEHVSELAALFANKFSL